MIRIAQQAILLYRTTTTKAKPSITTAGNQAGTTPP